MPVGCGADAGLALNDLETKKLRYFIAIAECGSFAAASRRLNVAQPGLSHQMTNFESDIGAPIVLRSSQGCRRPKPASFS
ncbi:helix-turn-helix domain-containing protein [Oceaniglobus trochenteri]|uniref:helix-turn-helix domain-containing protein n=1 Tax=Oceaniglobus trochenteri TaxID=2763260 RepID=UPI001CFFC04F